MNRREALWQDFVQWSGGFTPDECTPEEIEQYIKSALSTDYTVEEARALLLAGPTFEEIDSRWKTT